MDFLKSQPLVVHSTLHSIPLLFPNSQIFTDQVNKKLEFNLISQTILKLTNLMASKAAEAVF